MIWIYSKDQGHIDFIETEILLDDISFFQQRLIKYKKLHTYWCVKLWSKRSIRIDIWRQHWSKSDFCYIIKKISCPMLNMNNHYISNYKYQRVFKTVKVYHHQKICLCVCVLGKTWISITKWMLIQNEIVSP